MKSRGRRQKWNLVGGGETIRRTPNQAQSYIFLAVVCESLQFHHSLRKGEQDINCGWDLQLGPSTVASYSYPLS